MSQSQHGATPAADVGWAGILKTGYLGQFALLCLGIWLHAADSLVVATAMPAAVAEIGGDRFVSWALSLYLLGSILSGAGAALCATAFGLRRAFVIAALVYAAGCATSAMAPEIMVMLAGRLAQGLGGGLLVALTYVAVQRLFPREMWPRLIALMSAIWGAAAFTGPLIGGFFADLGLWRWAFWSFGVQALVLAVLVPALMTPSTTRTVPSPRFPLMRLALLSASVLLVAAAGVTLSPATSLPMLAGGAAFFVLFLKNDASRGTERMFPVSAFSMNSLLGAGFVANLALGAAAMSLTVYGPFILNRLHGVTALGVGLIIAAESVAWSLAAVAFAGTGEAGEKFLIRIGALMILFAIAVLGPLMAGGPIWAVALAAVVQGAGFGMLWGFLIRRVVAAAAEEDRDSASAAMPTTQQIAFALGAALSGIVANQAGFTEGGSASMANVALWVFAAFVPVAALGAAAAWRVAKD